MTTLQQDTYDTSPKNARHSAGRIATAAGIALLAGLAAGAIWGLGARIAMRLVALLANHYPDFSWQGTLGIVMMGAFLGMAFGLPYPIMRRFVPAGRGLRVLAYGLLALVTLFIGMDTIIQSETASMRQVGRLLFMPLLVAYGSLTAIVFERLEPVFQNGRQGRYGTALLALPYVLALCFGALIYLLSTEMIRL